jgi:hypothetical protein
MTLKARPEQKANPVPAQDAETQLSAFIASYTPQIGSLAVAIREEMRNLYPMANELVYDNYNALAIGFGPSEKASEAVFSIALFPRWVSLFFLQARGLPDPDRLLKGSGNVARYVVLSSPEMLHQPAIAALMREAVARTKVAFDPENPHRLIIKSVSAKQRPRRPAGDPQQNSAKASGKPAKSKKSMVVDSKI